MSSHSSSLRRKKPLAVAVAGCETLLFKERGGHSVCRVRALGERSPSRVPKPPLFQPRCACRKPCHRPGRLPPPHTLTLTLTLFLLVQRVLTKAFAEGGLPHSPSILPESGGGDWAHPPAACQTELFGHRIASPAALVAKHHLRPVIFPLTDGRCGSPPSSISLIAWSLQEPRQHSGHLGDGRASLCS